MTNVNAVSDLLKPYDAGSMRCYPVGTRINNVFHDAEDLSTPVELGQIQTSFFDR